jgi:hypothetical protein
LCGDPLDGNLIASLDENLIKVFEASASKAEDVQLWRNVHGRAARNIRTELDVLLAGDGAGLVAGAHVWYLLVLALDKENNPVSRLVLTDELEEALAREGMLPDHAADLDGQLAEEREGGEGARGVDGGADGLRELGTHCDCTIEVW